ncbi:MAG: hypothetical protein HY360_24440 [Verrucomicrobia bacterium]|nr:hypothetical protein [Verrucomicrobiota bacterium]
MSSSEFHFGFEGEDRFGHGPIAPSTESVRVRSSVERFFAVLSFGVISAVAVAFTIVSSIRLGRSR